MILRVGLTGGLASGKSTVARRLADHGIPTLDADQVVRSLYEPGGAGSRAVAEEFGSSFLGPDGAVDRARIGSLVFSDAPALERLNRRIHPLVLEWEADWFRRLEQEGRSLGVVEATLLVETLGRARYDVLVVLSAPVEARVARALKRSPAADPEDLRRRIRAQLLDEVRERAADIVIRSDAEKDVLLLRVDALAKELRRRADSLARG